MSQCNTETFLKCKLVGLFTSLFIQRGSMAYWAENPDEDLEIAFRAKEGIEIISSSMGFSVSLKTFLKILILNYICHLL
jgi:hypothetical protein